MRVPPATAARLVLALKMRMAGGPGSGNFGHAGRPGEVGGSASDSTFGPVSASHLAQQRVEGIAAIEKLLPEALENARYTKSDDEDEDPEYEGWSGVSDADQDQVKEKWVNDEIESGDFYNQYDDSEFMEDALDDLKKSSEFHAEIEEHFFKNIDEFKNESNPLLPLEGEEPFNLVSEIDPDTLIFDEDDVETLIDTEGLKFKSGQSLSPEQIEIVEAQWKASYEKELESATEDIRESGAYSEAMSNAEWEYIHDKWNNLSDNKKYEMANEMGIYGESSSDKLGGYVDGSEPDNWVTGMDEYGESSIDQAKTRAISNKLAELRTEQLLQERGLNTVKATVLPPDDEGKYRVIASDFSLAPNSFSTKEEAEAYAATLPTAQNPNKIPVRQEIDMIWTKWKNSSSNDESLAFQIATAKEFDGLHRLSDDEVKRVLADSDPREQAIFQAYARAQWETTQFVLDRAGVKDVKVYRGLQMAGAEVDAQDHLFLSPQGNPLKLEVERKTAGDGMQTTFARLVDPTVLEDDGERKQQPRVYYGQVIPAANPSQEFIENHMKTVFTGVSTQLPNLPLKKAGLQSTTTDADVANSWGGVGNLPPNPKRVVLRAHVPATSVLSLPVFGQNIHREREVVVMGAKDRWEWDTWKQAAPQFENQPIKPLNQRVYKGLRAAAGKMVIDLQALDANKPHWLNPIAQLITQARKRKQWLSTLGGPGSGNFGHAGRPGEIGGSASAKPGGGAFTINEKGQAKIKNDDTLGKETGWNRFEGQQPYDHKRQPDDWVAPDVQHKLSRDNGAWGYSHSNSYNMTGIAAESMGLEGWDKAEDRTNARTVKNFLTTIAEDEIGSEETLHHSFENVRKTNFKVGDTMRLPLTATSGNVGSYGTRLDAENQSGMPTVFEFEPGTQMLAYNGSTLASAKEMGHKTVKEYNSERGILWDEAIVAGGFEVTGVQNNVYFGSQHDNEYHRNNPGYTSHIFGTVVRLKQTETFHPEKGWSKRGGSH